MVRVATPWSSKGSRPSTNWQQHRSASRCTTRFSLEYQQSWEHSSEPSTTSSMRRGTTLDASNAFPNNKDPALQPNVNRMGSMVYTEWCTTLTHHAYDSLIQSNMFDKPFVNIPHQPLRLLQHVSSSINDMIYLVGVDNA